MNNIITGFSHSFDTGVAQALGLNAASVYNHILYWLRHNFVEGTNFEEGKTWTYNSFEKMTKYMPYLTKDQIRRSLEDLFQAGLIIKSNFNNSKFDRTSWYSVPDQSVINGSKNDHDKANLPNGQGEFAKSKRRDCHLYNTREEPRENPRDIHTPPSGGECVSSVPDREKKIERVNNVSTTQDQHSKLVEKYGEELTATCYQYLSDWKQSASPSTVKKHSSDYMRITGWAMQAVREKIVKEAQLATQEAKINPSASAAEIPSGKKCIISDNRKWAQNIANGYHIKAIYGVTASDTSIEIKSNRGSIPIGYAEHGFRDQVNKALHLHGFL